MRYRITDDGLRIDVSLLAALVVDYFGGVASLFFLHKKIEFIDLVSRIRDPRHSGISVTLRPVSAIANTRPFVIHTEFTQTERNYDNRYKCHCI